jgi:ankyrin repeat protein
MENIMVSHLSSTNLALNESIENIVPAYAERNLGESTPKSVGDRHNLSPLLRASCWGFEDLVRELIKDGADMSDADLKGESALHKAARFAHLSVAIELLRNNCDVNPIDNLGMTPLHWAALNGNAQLTRLLLLHNAKVTIRDLYAGGMTARKMAELMGHDAVLGVMDKYRWVSE